jgi:hypothetical protein
MTALAAPVPDFVDAALARLAGAVHRARPELRALASAGGEQAQDRALADWLYGHWYSQALENTRCTPVPPGRADLTPALRAALAATGRWEPGWVALKALPGHACLAGRGQLVRVIPAGDYANVARPGVPVAPGDGLAVLDRLDWVDDPTGFWAARSLAAEPEAPHRRVYWSVGWESAATVLRGLAPALDAADRPWSLKCPTRAADFARVDSLVVYLARADWPAFEPHLTTLAPQLAACLRDALPPLALPIARGAALADSPTKAQSFGQSRCLALAPGVRALLATAHAGSGDAIALLKQGLRAAGIDPARPWAEA